MNTFIGIDMSLTSTGVCIEHNGVVELHIFTPTRLVKTKKMPLSKWYNMCEPFVTYHFINDADASESNHNFMEHSKIILYSEIVQSIMMLIRKYDKTVCKISIEDYSQHSMVGPLIDLVTLGTLFRKQLIDSEYIYKVFPPLQVKMLCAKMTYPPIYTDKKQTKAVYRNNDGIAGGKFTKHEMCRAIIENTNWNIPYIKYLRDNVDVFLGKPVVNKPFEDLNDAFILKEISKL